jgi:manganese transport protein
MNLVDSVVALNLALFVNAAILILAAAVFHGSGHENVAQLEDAHRLLAPLLGTSLAATAFAIALLCSGQASTITGTLAGQIVMEGFLRIRIRPWLRRLISRGLAIIPAALVIGIKGPGSVDELLVLSQVVLSLQLAFAVIPLVTFTSDRRRMGEFVNPPWVIALAILVTLIIVGLNGNLVAQSLVEWLKSPGATLPLRVLVFAAIAAVTMLLGYVALAPIFGRFLPMVSQAPEGAPAHVPGGIRPPREISESAPRRVALALELGRADGAVLDQVRSMALPSDARIFLLHVAESAASRYLGPETQDQESREDQAALEQIAAELRASGLEVDVMLGHGNVQRELARMVDEVGADLLITGSHGHRLLGDLFHGATTSGLRHLVRCPVLTVRADARARRAPRT